MQIKELHIKKKNTGTPEQREELLKKLRKERAKLVKGMFEFTDAKGGWLDFVYKILPEDPHMTIRLTHGEICELPMDIVKHLNNTKKKVRTFGLGAIERGGELPERGLPSTFTVESRVKFIPMDVL